MMKISWRLRAQPATAAAVSAAAAIAFAFASTLTAADDPIARVRSWRAAHEMQILRELFDFLALPNVAANKADIQKNADALARMFERRRRGYRQLGYEICGEQPQLRIDTVASGSIHNTEGDGRRDSQVYDDKES